MQASQIGLFFEIVIVTLIFQSSTIRFSLFCLSVALLFFFNTSVVQFSRCSFGPKSDGGDNRNRTDDPLLAKQVLSQLSYTPK